VSKYGSRFIIVAASIAVATASVSAQQVAPERAALEERFRERTAEVVRRRLQLNDDQMARLRATNQQFDRQRTALVADERQARQALRAELVAGDAANQQKVAGLLDQLMRVQRRRLDLVESEQRELGKFLTPVQRAKYFALQNEIRKRVEELRDRPGARRGNAPLGNLRPRRILR
jgi:Spy/CpxP family protein refolding chaperone